MFLFTEQRIWRVVADDNDGSTRCRRERLFDHLRSPEPRAAAAKCCADNDNFNHFEYAAAAEAAVARRCGDPFRVCLYALCTPMRWCRHL